MTWRVAKSIHTLQDELDAVYPNRTKPDWTIGDADHQTRASDHNPNDEDVVCAVDVREGGIDLGEVAEQLKRDNHRAVKYVIYNRRIWSKRRNSEGWRTYNGPNAHTTHMHVSVGRGPDGGSTGPYDDTSPWGIADIGSDSKYESYRKGVKAGSRTIAKWGHRPRSAGDDVKELQRILNAWYPKLEPLERDGYYGPKTEARVKYLQKRAKIVVDGITGPQTWGTLNVI